MAARLVDSYGPEVPRAIADSIRAVDPGFDSGAFLAASLDGFTELDLMARGRAIADALTATLPSDPAEAMEVLVGSLPDVAEARNWHGMTGFRLLPYGMYVGEHGLDDFEPAMAALYEITRRFTAEFAIRPFLIRHEDRTLAVLREWATDPDERVRRLVSEGTRPRLPWATQLPRFIDDPAPVLELLELLRDDPSEYVRRSVANNLNDIAKDHPTVVVDVARRWWSDAGAQRQRLIRHGLRTLVKAGDPAALAVLGYRPEADLRVEAASIDPARPRIGGSVRVGATITNRTVDRQSAVVDVRISFPRPSGRNAVKVFKGRTGEIEPGGALSATVRVSLAQLSTRRHHAGPHGVEVLVNGTAHPIGGFDLLESVD